MPRAKPLPKVAGPNQSTMKHFYKPLGHFLDESILVHPSIFHHQAMSFRNSHEQIYSSWYYLGTFNYICYYHDAEFCEYRAYALRANGLEVGQLSIDDDYYVYGLYVGKEFMRQGIGTTLVRLANKTTHQPGQPPRLLVLIGQQHLHTREHPAEYQLTENGWALIQHCRNIGILQHDQLIGTTPPNSPVRSPNYYEY